MKSKESPPSVAWVPTGEHCPSCGAPQPLCESHYAHDGRKGERVTLRECRQCHLAWQFPVGRTAEQSVEYFASHYQDAQARSYFDKDARKGVARLQLEFVHSLRARPGSLLDIGAGDGTFMACAADAGWHCTGLEPSSDGTFAHSTSGAGSAEMLAVPIESLLGREFDVITLWDVIEHVERPMDVLLHAVALLEDDGLLVVETGNYHSIDRIEGGSHWWCYQLDHRWYFSPATLRPLLQSAGLEHVLLADKVLRPWWKGDRPRAAPSLWTGLKAVLRSPSHPVQVLRRQSMLRHAAAHWGPGEELAVFTLAASRQAMSASRPAPRKAAVLDSVPGS
jgi:2-polyprenyl-3-methyl-5-hydroxy-6-metoxy-1,4-benzoquinol methylase